MTKRILNVEQIPEVKAFVEASTKMERIREAYPEAISAFRMVAEEYNTALTAADKAVRATGCSCGPFQVLSVSESYDPEQLHEYLGETEFFKLGGVAKTVIQLDFPKDKVKAAIANGRLPSEVAEQACKRTPRYKKPQPVEI